MHILSLLEENGENNDIDLVKKISILDAVNIISSAWKSVK